MRPPAAGPVVVDDKPPTDAALYPTPIVDDGEDDDIKGRKSVLPNEAMTNFDELRCLLATTNGHNHASVRTVENCPSVQLKRRKLNELAVSTVMLLEDEISHWMSGIAELEHMLAATNSGHNPSSCAGTNLPVSLRSESREANCMDDRPGGFLEDKEGDDVKSAAPEKSKDGIETVVFNSKGSSSDNSELNSTFKR